MENEKMDLQKRDTQFCPHQETRKPKIVSTLTHPDGHQAKTMADCRRMAIAFASSVG